MSNTLPWRTLATPSTPSDFSAPSIALPWGSRMPDFSVTVTRAFMGVFPRSVIRYGTNRVARNRYRAQFPQNVGQFTRKSPQCTGAARLLQQPAAAGDMAALADEPHRRPERRLRARHHRNAMALLERLATPSVRKPPQEISRPSAPAPAAQTLAPSAMMSASLLLAGLAEAEQAEALERQHLEALRLEKALAAGCSPRPHRRWRRRSAARRSAAAHRPPPGSWCSPAGRSAAASRATGRGSRRRDRTSARCRSP